MTHRGPGGTEGGGGLGQSPGMKATGLHIGPAAFTDTKEARTSCIRRLSGHERERSFGSLLKSHDLHSADALIVLVFFFCF